MKKFGERVRYLRIKKGFSSQIDLANKIGTDRTYVGGIERGERNPTFEILEKLAKVLETTMSDLLKFDPSSQYSSSNKMWVLNDKKDK